MVRCQAKHRRVGRVMTLALIAALGVASVSPVRAQAPQEPPADAQPAPRQKEQVTPPAKSPVAEESPAPAESPEHKLDPALEKIINSMDPSVFNKLVGAEVDVEVVGDQMMLKGPEDAVATLQMLINLLDKTTDKKVLQIVRVYKRDANEIASTIEQPLRDVLGGANQRDENKLSVTALSPGVLLVSAVPDEIDFVLDVISQVDEEEELPEFEQLVFPIKYLKASEVATQLQDILKKINERVGKSGAAAEIQIVPNNANNSVLVIAPEEQRLKIQKLINEIDVQPAAGWSELKLTLYPLLHSNPTDLAKTITDLLASQKDRQKAEEAILRLNISKSMPDGKVIQLPAIDLQKPSRIIPDPGTRSLIIATAAENVEPMGELVRLLDAVAIADEVGVKIFPLTFADAQAVSTTLQEVFDKGKKLPEDPDGSGADAVAAGAVGEAVAYNVSVSTDDRTNTVIVAGRQDQLMLAETIVSELDRPATALKFPLHLLGLEHTDATRVGKIITELFDKRIDALTASGSSHTALERERVFLSVDARSNMLIVSASEENLAEIRSITSQLDTKPANMFDQIRIVPCGRITAADLKKKIDELWKRKASLRAEEKLLEDAPVIVADDRSNTLVIASSVEDFQDIKLLVDKLATMPVVDDIQLFELRFADAQVLSKTLDDLFKGLAGQSDSFKAPTVLPDPRSNALVVAGSRDSMQRVADVVKRLDVEAGPLTAVFKVYPLKHGSATRLAPRMQELFDKRSASKESSGTPVVILPDEASNSLVCSASRDDHDVIVDLLGLLDRPSNLAKQVQIFPLHMAKAATVADKLKSLFPSKGGTSGGSDRADVIASEADERTNSIIVWAAPTEMQNIAQVIKRLDTATPAVEMMVKVIQLKQALAEDFAKLLQDVLLGDSKGSGDDQRAIIVSFLEKQQNGDETLRKLLRQDIKIEADTRTNSLMVMAPADSMDMLEAMIHDFDRIRPVTSEIRLFPLVNSDAKTMVDQLNNLFQQQTGESKSSGGTTSQLVFGQLGTDEALATIGQELRFAADPRTNTLIVAGSPVYLSMIEDLVRYLDSQEAEDRIAEVYQAKYAKGSDIATAVQGFVGQELNVVGQSNDQESQIRRQERQVSVQAIGDNTQGSSSVIIGTSRRGYQRTMDIVRALDRPEPQVRIAVLIAQVSITDDVELGVELAGQDLSFTKNAVLGPNGVIKGPHFDVVGGTNLNASGNGLGFNFTVTGEDFGFLLHAMQTNSRLEVLSRPILLVRNGEKGNITIADQVPIVEQSNVTDSGQVQSTIGRQDVGIILTASPHISPDGYVTIEFTQEISNVAGENVQLTEGVSSPVFQKRSVETNVTVRDGETVIIGGLIEDQLTEGTTKVPVLGDLPYLGWLFQTQGSTHRRTELMVVLTVDIVSNDEDLHDMSVAERNRYELPNRVLESPMMEGLRITPLDAAMGPAKQGAAKFGTVGRLNPRTDSSKSYGPNPQVYGPKAPHTTPKDTTPKDTTPKDTTSTDASSTAVPSAPTPLPSADSNPKGTMSKDGTPKDRKPKDGTPTSEASTNTPSTKPDAASTDVTSLEAPSKKQVYGPRIARGDEAETKEP